MISAVGVVVPARDEQPTIVACLRALTTALTALSSTLEVTVCVIADRCRDDTAALAAKALPDNHGTVLVNEREPTIGGIRALGVTHVLDRLAHHGPTHVWLLSTDADTLVCPDWARHHVRLADHGVHAVAGVAALSDGSAMPVTAPRPEGHGNVYAANLGVRADAYRAVGGFRAVACGEDHDLWLRLRHHGYRCLYRTEPRVMTSARRQGRAHGGLADLLTRLDRD